MFNRAHQALPNISGETGDAEKIAALMDVEGAEFAARLQTAEAREAFMAFAERRAPDFSKVG